MVIRSYPQILKGTEGCLIKFQVSSTACSLMSLFRSFSFDIRREGKFFIPKVYTHKFQSLRVRYLLVVSYGGLEYRSGRGWNIGQSEAVPRNDAKSELIYDRKYTDTLFVILIVKESISKNGNTMLCLYANKNCFRDSSRPKPDLLI